MKVYFNNSCKICRSEINMYKKENIEDIEDAKALWKTNNVDQIFKALSSWVTIN